MTAPGLLHWRRILPPPEPPLPDLLAESLDRAQMAESAAKRLCRTYLVSAPSRAGRAPDWVVFGPPYAPVRESTPQGWRARSCGCGARWHGDGDTRCWACGETAC